MAGFVEERRELKHCYFRIVESEDRALKLRCKATWAREGDAKLRNTISKLENAEWVIVEDEEEIIKMIVGFYESLQILGR